MEQELIQRLINGDKVALSKLYDKYAGALYGVLIRICKNEEVAQDLLQETFIKIWQKASSYDPEKGRFYTWSYRIARNCALNEVRKSNDLIQNKDLSVYIDTPNETANDIDELKLIGAINNLAPHHKRTLELIYFQGLTHREAHVEMSVPLGTFKSYVQQALKELRTYYQQLLIIIWVVIERIS